MSPAAANDEIQSARDSLSRCVKNPAFLDRFYQLFVDSSAEIRKKFEKTDFARQKRVLQDSLFLMLVSAGTTGGPAHAELSKLAERHSRGQLDIKPEWYDVWLRCLLQAVAEYDPEYRSELASAWRKSIKEGIDFLAARY
jgi:hemoglobin-like flavoprotein